eukprot:CAMPEP_0194288802 /NCGR_PEP_ID=MMETSP0169-20130528/37625_1 /TAXON_ID=218684 /ORGANISM="Corethron pennatum, Strain L29A3" /LENGTH=1373 /DNA_ID=CAMNT_0039035903 /DNA_START=122 /DNA_END=4243 /DNA_ORIENTATION=-
MESNNHYGGNDMSQPENTNTFQPTFAAATSLSAENPNFPSSPFAPSNLDNSQPVSGQMESPDAGNVAAALFAAAAGSFNSQLQQFQANSQLQQFQAAMAIAQHQQLMLLQGNTMVQDQTGSFGSGPVDFNSSAAIVQLMQQATSNTQQFTPMPPPEPKEVTEHFLTISTDGTILSVTTPTITGVSPSSLIMTSAYDSVHAQDKIGLRSIATNFWERGSPEVAAYIRRQMTSGKWVWLSAQIERYVDTPVPGAIIRETLVKDEKKAKFVARTTRISALLATAVEAAHLRRELGDSPDDNGGKNKSDGSAGRGEHSNAKIDGMGESRERKTTLNALTATVDAVRSGVSLDLSMITLSTFELQMIRYVITGGLQIEDLGSLVVEIFNTKNTGNIVSSLDAFVRRKSEAEKMRHNCQFSQFPPQSNSLEKNCPPPLSVLNLSYTNLGNQGLEILCEVFYANTPTLKTLDVGFCGIDERGILNLCKAFYKRKKRGLRSLQGLVLSGNAITYKAAKELGVALSYQENTPSFRKKQPRKKTGTGFYTEDDDEEDDDDDDMRFSRAKGFKSQSSFASKSRNSSGTVENKKDGLILLHIACSSLRPNSLYQLLVGLGFDSPLRELHIASNNIGPEGASVLVSFLEGSKANKRQVMPYLDRLDISNNDLGNDGTAEITRIISKRSKINFVDLRLSSNNIGAGGIETLMNKLLQHNLLSLHLENNTIGDRGCQLVAASLPSMHVLLKLSLSFNNIGSRGINALMRSLIGCESIQSLSLSGNVMKISGAISMGFALAQHPRLSELDLDNCCLSQVAQCHIVSGIISNRWVPMRLLKGFRVAPPMIVIGSLDHELQNMTNEECFKVRRDLQMKTISTWMQPSDGHFTSQSVGGQEVEGAPSQSAYHRMLEWLSCIPFDEDELADLHSFFFDNIGIEDDSARGSEAHLRHRGDLLANLSNETADEIRNAENDQMAFGNFPRKIGYSLDTSESEQSDAGLIWNSLQKYSRFRMRRKMDRVEEGKTSESSSLEQNTKHNKAFLQNGLKSQNFSLSSKALSYESLSPSSGNKRRKSTSNGDLGGLLRSRSMGKSVSASLVDLGGGNDGMRRTLSAGKNNNFSLVNLAGDDAPGASTNDYRSSDGTSKASLNSFSTNDSEVSFESKKRNIEKKDSKARIALFPEFKVKLDKLKDDAQNLMDCEDDPQQQDSIAQNFAQRSLTYLRQLRYHCMNSGLDGWRQGSKIRRKVLIVDDSLTTRKLVSRAFERANFIVDTAADGKAGLAKLKEMIYDIAFMDIDMPVMNGFDATKELRLWEDNKRPGTRQPICALTGTYVDDFERSELMKFKEAGLDVMESKPCNIPRLFKVVDDVSPMFSDLSISVTKLSSEKAV